MWISVETKYPEYGGKYIVYFSNDCMNEGYSCVDCVEYLGNKKWDTISIRCDITHWMSLPEPPK